jgi:HAD superfamily hydrolase (TIGR01458 family)
MIRGILLDLSGVLYVGDEVLPGARRAVSALQRAHLPLRFVTNTTRTPRRVLLDRLADMGFTVSPELLFSAPKAARDYLTEHGLNPYLVIHPDLAEEFRDFPRTGANAVLMGDAGPSFTYERLNTAFRLLMDGAPLLAMGRNRYFREAAGFSLDQGPFVAAMEYAAETEALVLGKPAPAFYQAAVASLGVPADEVLMVGDDAEADVDGALAAGLQAALVQTGKYREGVEATIQHPGAHVFRDIGAVAEWLLGEGAEA